MTRDTRHQDRLARAKRLRQVTTSGVHYDEDFPSAEGVHVTLFWEAGTTPGAMLKAIRQLRYERDVVGFTLAAHVAAPATA